MSIGCANIPLTNFADEMEWQMGKPYEGTAFHKWLWGRFQAWLERDPRRRQVDLAAQIGIGPASLSNYLAGQRLPERRNRKLIARFFGIADVELERFIAESEGVVTREGTVPIPPPPSRKFREVFALYAGHVLTPEERREAEQVLRELREREQDIDDA